MNTDYTKVKSLGRTNLNRWEEGIEHHPLSERLVRFIKDHDFYDYNDYFCWKVGGDGDNGETLMYQMDPFFEVNNPIITLKNPEYKIKLVKQRSSKDCGIACAAMVANVHYLTVLRRLRVIYPELLIKDLLTSALSQRMLDNLLKALNMVPIRDKSEIYGELLPNSLYIMAIPPRSGSLGHFIVIDTRSTPYEIFDPNTSKKKKMLTAENPPLSWAGLVKIKVKVNE